MRVAALWILGLVTAVPYATYYLLFEATRDQYALLITFVLFWIFGYWSLAAPLMAAVKVRRVFRSIEQAAALGSKEELIKTLRSDDAREAAIDLIATENRIPRFLAARIYGLLMRRLSENRVKPEVGGDQA